MAVDNPAAPVRGINVEAVTDWLVANVAGLRAPFSFELIAGGRSNLTFAVSDDGGRRVVLRRPPTSHVLSTAHDMGREHKIISALAGTDVPVPPVLGFCEDVAVNEAPFYLMDFVDGHILRGGVQAEKALDVGARRAAGDALVDVLVALHDVDVDAVGLGDLGRRDGYIERQLKRWYGQFQQSQEQERQGGSFRPAEVVDEVHALLAAQIPEQHGVSIAHGDYKLDNTVIGEDGRVLAVLDWELCTLGDPLSDLGTLWIYWTDPPAVAPYDKRMLPATAVEGFPTRAELAARYAERSGRDVSSLPYYVAFGHWKLACIMEGVYARYAAGAMGDQQVSADGMGQAVLHRAGLALEAIRGL